MKKTLLMIIVVGSLCIAGTSQAVNAFDNGGFETVGTTFPAESWQAAASGYSLSNDARTGNFALELSSPAFNAAVALQNNVEDGGQPPLVVGDNPELSFWAKGTAGGTGNVNFALRFLDGTGNILYDSGLQFFQGSINTSSYSEITFTPNPVPTGAVAAFIEFSQAIGPIDGGNPAGQVLIDDLSLEVIPEPASLALLGLGGLAMLGRRSRKG